VHVCTIVPISKAVGANRIYPGIAIPHCTGNPDLSPEREKAVRLELVKNALNTLTVKIADQTVFK
jgi:betaine reductase